MIRFQSFPRSVGINTQAQKIIDCFIQHDDKISSKTKNLKSNNVFEIIRKDLEKIGMKIETGKTIDQKIQVPVLFGYNNKIDQCFEADGISNDGKIVLEVEAGRAVVNYQFLKDIFEASMMYKVETLVLAVRNDYRKADDFKKIYTFLETLYISDRIKLPLKEIVLIGY
jgi:hypothetical protein